MAKFYSPSTLGFYDPEIHGADIPSDAEPLTDEEYRLRTAGPQGLPVQVNTDPGIRAELILGQLREIDAKKMRALTDALLNSDTTRLQALENQAAALRAELASLST
jgi:hypothetical protein